MAYLDDFTPDAVDASIQGKPAPTYIGHFKGDPAAAQDAISHMSDPIERENAQRAFDEQAKRTPGFDKGAPFGGAPAAPLADFTPEAVHAAVTAPAPAAPKAPATAPANSQTITSPEFDLTANQVTGLGSSAVGGVAGGAKFLYKLATTGDLDKSVDAGVDTLHSIQQSGTYTPKTARGQQMVEQFGGGANPLSWPALLGEKAGGFLADHGLPGVGALTNAAVTAGAPLAIKPLVRAGTTRLADIGKPPAPRIEPTLERTPQPQITQQDGTVLQPQVPPQPVNVGGQRVRAAQNPPATVPNAPAKAAEPFRDIENDQPITDKAEQLRRANVLASVGIDTARQSSLTGDKLGGSTDLQLSKVENPAGKLMESQIAGEKQALADHATKLVEETGGTLDKDQNTAYHRGETIIQPLNDLKAHYDAKAAALYDAADARSQGQPVTLDSFRSMLADDSEMTSPDFVQFRDAAKAFAKKNGMLQDDGSVSGTALQAETLRKWLNSKRTYGNSSFVDGLKESLDNDVMSSAGEDLYTEARALWREKKNTLDNPNGMGKLMQAEGPDGINRPIPIEQVAQKLARMPVDQFAHVVNTLKNAPPEIQPSATASLNEIRAHFANEVRNVGASQAGQWNAKGATKYLRDNAARMNQVFTPEEMAKFQNLSEAGQIVAKDQSYPGAAAQAHNLGRLGVTSSFMVKNVPATVGTVAGGVVGGHVGAVAGGIAGRAAGEKMATSLSDKTSLKAAQQRTVKLSDLLGTGK